MLINAASRSYTSNIVADADLNLEGYNVTANALYSKDNYLLTMLDYGEAFPTDVKEGDKLFAWGEDSTKSYIYTYKQGAWDAGVKPQHMADYYIADENRTVRFCLVRSRESVNVFVTVPPASSSRQVGSCVGLLFGPDVYILGDAKFSCGFGDHAYSCTTRIYQSSVVYTNCTTVPVSTFYICSYGDGSGVLIGDGSGCVGKSVTEVAVFPVKVNGFRFDCEFFGATGFDYYTYGMMGFEFDL